jgi:hypothetical protein
MEKERRREMVVGEEREKWNKFIVSNDHIINFEKNSHNKLKTNKT